MRPPAKPMNGIHQRERPRLLRHRGRPQSPHNRIVLVGSPGTRVLGVLACLSAILCPTGNSQHSSAGSRWNESGDSVSGQYMLYPGIRAVRWTPATITGRRLGIAFNWRKERTIPRRGSFCFRWHKRSPEPI
jgi:hypothetical protein